MIEIYTDGSCRKNNIGGWGIAIFKDNTLINVTYDEEENTTSNRMEISAILNALEYASTIYKDDKVIIYSDSAYCVNMFNDWIYKWYDRGWTRVRGESIENLDLVQKLYKYASINFPNFIVNKIRGHQGIIGNEIADALATASLAKLEKIFKDNDINIEKEIII